jgi:hypothetical protein
VQPLLRLEVKHGISLLLVIKKNPEEGWLNVSRTRRLVPRSPREWSPTGQRGPTSKNKIKNLQCNQQKYTYRPLDFHEQAGVRVVVHRQTDRRATYFLEPVRTKKTYPSLASTRVDLYTYSLGGA